jgi:hypothetical protein
MLKFNLTEKEELLMKKVCELQLDSFKRILNGQQEPEIREKLIEHHLSESELNNLIFEVESQYKDICDTPAHLFKVHSDLIGNFREALDFNTEYLSDFSGLIPSMLKRLDLAIYIVNHRN